MEEEKREEDILEEDTNDILEEITDSSGDDSQDSGRTAEDAVSKEDTITGSVDESTDNFNKSSEDTVSQSTVETNTDSHHGHDYNNPSHEDHKSEDLNHEHLGDHNSNHTHEHHAIVNQNKPWEARNVEVRSESESFENSDSGMGTGAHSGSDDHISINKEDFWKYVKIIAVIAVLILGYNYYTEAGVTGNVVANAPGNAPPAIAEVSIDDDAIKGEKDAPVTIIEFSDYECPFCARFYSQTLNQIDEKYIKTGKVRLVYRDFPLSIHANAPKAGEAAECAGEQDKYYEMHDILFENGVSGGVASYKVFAGQIGLDQAKFDSCLDSGEMASEVQKDFADGSKYGVQGTPAFFINGKLISGAQPFSVFEAAIEAELA